MYHFDHYILIVKQTEEEFYTEVPEQRFLARLKEVPEASLHAYGHTREEATANLKELFDWLQKDCAERHASFPPPSPPDDKAFSGKIVLRMPAWLHARLSEQAEDDELSLNSLIVNDLIQCTTAKDTIKEMCSQWAPHYIKQSYEYTITQNPVSRVSENPPDYLRFLKNTSGYKHVD